MDYKDGLDFSQNSSVDCDRSDVNATLINNDPFTAHSRQQNQRVRKIYKTTIIIHALLLALNLGIFAFFFSTSHGIAPDAGLVYSPVQSLVSYEVRNFTDDHLSYYMGPPSPQREKNWHDLLQGELGIDIRITEEDIEALGRKENAVKLSDEKGGYAVLVNAYHELHCIKLLRQNLYPDYFYKEGDDDAGANFREHHVDHCLNYLRQAAMCRSDVGMSTWHWVNNSHIPVGRTMPHVCRKWDSIDDWIKERKINIYQPGLLVHPTLGVSFPYGALDDNPTSDGGA